MLVGQKLTERSLLAESDDHFPTLTVAETLRFATRARSGPQVSVREVDMMVVKLVKLVGLENVLNTKVGDAKIRGVSGGERRRVSLAEALATCARQVISPAHLSTKIWDSSTNTSSQPNLPG